MLHTYFVQTVGVLNVFEISFRNPLQVFNQVKGPNNFGLDFFRLAVEKVLEVVFIKCDLSVLLIFVHRTNLKMFS